MTKQKALVKARPFWYINTMYNHEPQNYPCPLCLVVKGIKNEHVYTNPADVIYQDKHITAFIASHWWPKNKGHVLIVPNKHIENIYDLPDALSNKIHALERRVALALKKTYKCDGVSSRQHNEHAGNQDVWHYHLHVFPRYYKDNLYLAFNKSSLSDPKARKPYTTKLRKFFANEQ